MRSQPRNRRLCDPRALSRSLSPATEPGGRFPSFHTDGRSSVVSAAEAWGWLLGPRIQATDPKRQPRPPLDSVLPVQALGAPHQLQFTKQGRDMKVKCPGAYIFQRGKKRLNYIFKRHRQAEEYQPCLGPEAEMPRTRIWKINTVELSTTAFFFLPLFFLGLWKAGEVNTQPWGRGRRDGNAPLPSSCTLLLEGSFQKKLPSPSLQWVPGSTRQRPSSFLEWGLEDWCHPSFLPPSSPSSPLLLSCPFFLCLHCAQKSRQSSCCVLPLALGWGQGSELSALQTRP